MIFKNKNLVELAVANQSGAMEADTIKKNGCNRKTIGVDEMFSIIQ